MTLVSWLPIDAGSDFSLYNLPYGIFSAPGRKPRPGVAIGGHIIDLYAAFLNGLLPESGELAAALTCPTLNELAAVHPGTLAQVRTRLQDLLLLDGHPALRELADQVLLPMGDCTLHLPVNIGDYTDFYASIDHATNVGKMFRGAENALMPNWRHMPIAYHGRSSSIVLSGTPIHRPHGQRKLPDAEMPVFSASQRLDFELEMGMIIGRGNAMGQRITTADAPGHIFGYVLFNDWSARDIQGWEYQPLGPFLGKNFASTISPWVVTPTALEPFRVAGPAQSPPVLPYLEFSGDWHYDLPLEVAIAPDGGPETVVTRSNWKNLYWNTCQMIAHHTVNGCPLRPGDLLASGTISGPERDAFGSLLELCWGGKEPLTLADGRTGYTFLQNGDTVTLRGGAGDAGQRVGFGEARGRVVSQG